MSYTKEFPEASQTSTMVDLVQDLQRSMDHLRINPDWETRRVELDEAWKMHLYEKEVGSSNINHRFQGASFGISSDEDSEEDHHTEEPIGSRLSD